MAERKGGPTSEQRLEEIRRSAKWSDLVEWMADSELQAGGAMTASLESIYLLEMIGLLLLDDFGNARYLWKRVPAQMQKSAKDLVALWKVGQALFQKDMDAFFKAVDHATWPPIMRPFVVRLRVEKSVHLIETAFDAIQLSKCAEMLGMTQEKAAQFARGKKWEVSKAGLVTPVRPEPKPAQELTQQQVTQLTNYMTQLEAAAGAK